MIIYSKNFWGLPNLVRLYGSAIPRTLAFAVLSSGLTAIFHFFPNQGYFRTVLAHPYPFQIFAFIVGFALVFRTNQGYQRYWEACTQLQAMGAALINVCSLSLAYETATVSEAQLSAPSAGFVGLQDAQTQQQALDRGVGKTSIPTRADSDNGMSGDSNETLPPSRLSEPHVQQVILFRNQLLHLASLFHGLALQHLRSDWHLSNLSEHDVAAPPPPLDGRGLRRLIASNRISIEDIQSEKGASRQWSRFYRAMKIPVLGSITSRERRLLKQHLETDGKDTVVNGVDPNGEETFKVSFLSEFFGGWTNAPGSAVAGAPERLYTVFLWLELLVAGRMRETDPNKWLIPATLSTNTMGQLSATMHAFEQCRKVLSIPFPFPWAQTIVLILLLFTLTLPFLMASVVNQLWLAVLLTFVPVLTYWALNEVASDLEDPFHYDPNELPLARQQFEFNKRLIAVAESALDFLSSDLPTGSEYTESSRVDTKDSPSRMSS